ncbi:hypothetical protein ACIRQY_19170 [Streptomyces sp. NPDC101490]|uniref:hypothetical protein n=1 Tax=Streptomyces sp. NPDC101490 TaxID=3366143 RepID=UPI0038229C9A
MPVTTEPTIEDPTDTEPASEPTDIGRQDDDQADADEAIGRGGPLEHVLTRALLTA